MDNIKLIVSSTPHIRANNSVDDIMLDVILALMPAAFAGVLFFGARALAVTVLSVISCVVFEALYEIIAKKRVTVKDLSAVVTGMLLAFALPPTVPYYAVVIGEFAAIVITKQLFGGIGQNFMNPALIGRAFLMASFPAAMTSFTTERLGIFEKTADVVTSATRLSPMAALSSANPPALRELFIGRMADGTALGGCIGETCSAAIILGLVYLVARRVISLRIPLTYMGSMMLMAMIFGRNPFEALFTGGVMLAAVFMATDYVTTPTTAWGQLIFGCGCGIITSVIRFWGGYPEGVTYAILLMNILTPLLDRWTVPKLAGGKKA